VTVEKGLVVLGTITGVVYVLAGIITGIWPSFWDDSSTGDRIGWIALLVGGGVLLLAGLRMSIRSPWPAAVLISVGAVAGALATFWTVVAPIVAITLVVLSILYARRRTAGTAPATG
jgi:hypothetical protein